MESGSDTGGLAPDPVLLMASPRCTNDQFTGKPWVSVLAGQVPRGSQGRGWLGGVGEGLTRLVPVPVGVHDLVPTEPAEGAGAVEVLQGSPEVLAVPVVDEAADKGLLEPARKGLVRAGSTPPTPPGNAGQMPCQGA